MIVTGATVPVLINAFPSPFNPGRIRETEKRGVSPPLDRRYSGNRLVRRPGRSRKACKGMKMKLPFRGRCDPRMFEGRHAIGDGSAGGGRCATRKERGSVRDRSADNRDLQPLLADQ